MKRIAILASGTGSNAEKIIRHFQHRALGKERNFLKIEVALIVSNKPDAGVLGIAEKENIPTLIIDKEKFFRGNGYMDELKEKRIDFIVLAGFLWKIPDTLLKAFPKKIVNLHPALLPRYGGKGFYGERVHQAVLDNKDKESGITIHFVDEHYDNGDIILQLRCPVFPADTVKTLAERIHSLEHENYPKVIEELLLKQS